MTYDFYFKDGLVIRDINQEVFDLFKEGIEEWTRVQTVRSFLVVNNGIIRVDEVVAILPSGTKTETTIKKEEK